MNRALVVALVAVAARRADAKGCTEHSAVVGFQHCGRFGEWSRDDDDSPRVWFDLGTFDHHYDTAAFSLADPAPAVASASPSDIHTHADGIAVRILGGLGPLFYTGLEVQAGDVHVDSPVVGPGPAATTFFGIHAIAGVHTSRLVFGFAAEVATGVRDEDLDSCVDRGCNDVTYSEARFELEACVRASVFVRPRWSFEVAFGHGLLDRGDYIFALSTTLHIRVLDGM